MENILVTLSYWDNLIRLSNKEKIAVIAGLSASMVEDNKENDEWNQALSLEEFRVEAKKRMGKIYG